MAQDKRPWNHKRPPRHYVADPPRPILDTDYDESLFSDFDKLGAGHSRAVFAFSETVVFKVPLNSEGQYANRHALQLGGAVMDSPRRDQYARCWAGTVADVDIIFMERVTVLAKTQDWLPHVDHDQVGRAADGEIVIYDYGG